MLLFQRYIFKELVYNFLFTFVVIAMIMLFAMAAKVLIQFHGLGIFMLLRNVPMMLANSLTIIIPASALVSAVMTYGRISADNEIVTLRAGGIHVLRILVPGILFGLIASLGLLIINDRIVPMAERSLKALEQDRSYMLKAIDTALKRGKKELDLPDGTLLTWDACHKIALPEGKDEEQESVARWRFNGLRVKIFDENGELTKEFVSESARLLADKEGRRVGIEATDLRSVRGGDLTIGHVWYPIANKKEKKSRVRLSMRNIAAIRALQIREEKSYFDHRVTTEFHKRIADSFSPLVFVFLSLPVAILFRQQNRMVAFLISIVLALFVYYPVSLLGETFAKKEIILPLLSIWPGNIALSAIGLVLILKVMRR